MPQLQGVHVYEARNGWFADPARGPEEFKQWVGDKLERLEVVNADRDRLDPPVVGLISNRIGHVAITLCFRTTCRSDDGFGGSDVKIWRNMIEQELRHLIGQ